jgi:hypothetical protein
MVGLRNQHDSNWPNMCIAVCSREGSSARLVRLQHGCGSVAKLRQGSSLMEGVVMVR